MHHPFLPEQFSDQPEPKKWFLTESQMKFVTAMISLAAVLIGVFGHQRKEIIELMFLVPGTLFLLTILPALVHIFKGFYVRRQQKRFVAAEYPRLQRLYVRLLAYADQNNGRSLRAILYSASAYQNDIVLRILNSDYIWTWMQCFNNELNDEKPHSLMAFMRQCNQFTAILSEFNRNYVIKTQKGMEQTPLEQEYIVDQLEVFREDFSHYLREIEEWANGVTTSALKVEPELYNNVQISPCPFFEKVKTFRKSKVASAG